MLAKWFIESSAIDANLPVTYSNMVRLDNANKSLIVVVSLGTWRGVAFIMNMIVPIRCQNFLKILRFAFFLFYMYT